MFKKLSITFVLVLVLAAGSFAPVSAQEVAPVDPINPVPFVEPEGIIDETADYWFVELNSKPTVEGTNPSITKAEKKAFRDAARRAGLKYTERMAFDTLWNGLSIQVDKSQLDILTRLPGVKAIYPVDVIAMPIPYEEQISPELFTALAMTGADVAQSELGYTGAGIKVAVMDTGIDYDHPDLGGCFGPGCRVAMGWDFVGDAFNADPTSATYNPVPVPDADPDDCNGHGSHVSGIIGANGVVKGVAPGVTFGAYRVFGCEGSTTADIMMAAMEKALADDMDILNMSIGSAYQWPQYPTAMAADRLVNKGMVVVASIGNNGANGLYSAGAPGLGKNVIGVAAFDNSHVFLPYFTVNGTNIGYITMTYSPPAPTTGTFEILDVGLACAPLEVDVTGKVALTARGGCVFSVKAINAIAAGAEAVLVSNNAAGVFNGTLGGPLPDPKPVVGISQEQGAFIRAQAAPVMMTWTDQQDTFFSPTGNLISSFSSYGLSPDLALKPDVGAPGGNIYSTYPLEKGGYATMSGTSMSSPHVAGAVALLLEAQPRLPAKAVRTVLQNSADPKLWWGNPGLGLLDNVHRQGAGMLDIDDAILATTRIEPAKIAAGESQAGPYTEMLTVTNNGMMPVTYTLSHLGALSTGPDTFVPSFFTGFATVTFSEPTITVPAGGSASVTVTITANAGLPDKSQYGGYIKFTPTTPGQSYTVPYGGFKGDYQSIQVLAPTKYGFPWLSVLIGGSYYTLTAPEDWTFTMQGTDYPFFLVHLDHQSRSMKMEIFDAVTGKAYHAFAKEEYLPRNSTTTGFFAFPFTGETQTGKKVFTVPDGTYVAKISLLKANGDASNPDHWEYWTSIPFVIDRP